MENSPSLRRPTRFFILAAGRTGSTRLRLLLDSHPSVRCHGEVFGENLSTLTGPGAEDPGVLAEMRSANAADFAKNTVFAAKGEDAVGFKILYHQLERSWEGLMEALVEEKDIRVIHLVRRNGIKRFLSEFFVGNVTQKNIFQKGEEIPPLNSVKIPVSVLLENLEYIEMASTRMRRTFRDHPFREVAYEDSLEDNGSAMREILKFLGVPSAELSVGIRKILPDDMRQIIANYDELATALRGSRFEYMLQP